MKSALKGDLEDVVLALLKTPAQYDAQQLKLAMKVHKHTHIQTVSLKMNTGTNMKTTQTFRNQGQRNTSMMYVSVSPPSLILCA